MIFNSLTFILICLVPCVSLTALADRTLKHGRISVENAILLLFSALFYLWSGVYFIRILLALIIANYICGLLLQVSKKFIYPGVVCNVMVLIHYKYLNLIKTTLNNLAGTNLTVDSIIAPLGISFIVFTCISYLMDICRNDAEVCKDPLKFALFIAFFPKIAQGPIVQYKDMESQLSDRNIEFNAFMSGIERFIIGLSKKVLIADILAQTSSNIFSHAYLGTDAGTAWIGIFSYTLCLYMDFSGYSDMAIGIAGMTGFSFKENFDFPYLSKSPGEFWRRWHISLGAWFREYLYIPLGGSRKGNVYVNLMIVFIVTGIWHGSAWIYLFWGMYHGFFVLVERWLSKRGVYEKIPEFLRWAGTFLIVMIGWIAFNVPTVTEFIYYIGLMLGKGKALSFTYEYFLNPRLLMLYFIVISGSLIMKWSKFTVTVSRLNKESVIFNIAKYLMLVCLLCLCFITSLAEGYSPFLYFQF